MYMKFSETGEVDWNADSETVSNQVTKLVFIENASISAMKKRHEHYEFIKSTLKYNS